MMACFAAEVRCGTEVVAIEANQPEEFLVNISQDVDMSHKARGMDEV